MQAVEVTYGGVGSEQGVFTREGEAFSQVVSCFANGLRMRRISLLNCNCIGGMETQFLAKPVFGVSPVHPGTLFQKSNNGLAKAAW